jgi:hypothetical protein
MKAIDAILERTFAELGEYADACQVLLTFEGPRETHMRDKGFGNFYARRGMAQQFIEFDIGQNTMESSREMD